jgi:hypothetical protein
MVSDALKGLTLRSGLTTLTQPSSRLGDVITIDEWH